MIRGYCSSIRQHVVKRCIVEIARFDSSQLFAVSLGDKTCLTVRRALQCSHTGGSELVRWWLCAACRVKATSSFLRRLLLDSHLLMLGRRCRRKQSGSLCHLASHSSRTSRLMVGLSSSASTLSGRICEEHGAILAAASAFLFP